MDGLKLYLAQSSDSVIQNMFYNGWTHDQYIPAVFVFCPDGTIPIATYNVPGCFHNRPLLNGVTFTGKYEQCMRVLEESVPLILHSARKGMIF